MTTSYGREDLKVRVRRRQSGVVRRGREFREYLGERLWQLGSVRGGSLPAGQYSRAGEFVNLLGSDEQAARSLDHSCDQHIWISGRGLGKGIPILAATAEQSSDLMADLGEAKMRGTSRPLPGRCSQFGYSWSLTHVIKQGADDVQFLPQQSIRLI
jgi:hypothetical protein